MQKRITPDPLPLKYAQDEVLVFPSNLQGIHGKGLAKLATAYGAKRLVGYGLEGQTFALPTRDKIGPKAFRTLEISEIAFWVRKFLADTNKYPDLKFYVPKIGCGNAGYTPQEMAPLFKAAMDMPKIYLPAEFWWVLEKI